MVYASNTFFSSCLSPNLDHLMPDAVFSSASAQASRIAAEEA